MLIALWIAHALTSSPERNAVQQRVQVSGGCLMLDCEPPTSRTCNRIVQMAT